MRLRSEKRRTYIVNRPLQRRIILSMSWPLAVVIVVALAVQWQFSKRLTEEAARAGMPVLGTPHMLYATASFFLYALISQLLIAVKFSNQIAGAAYRISETLKAYQEGERRRRANLRQGDYLTELADDVNEFLDWANRRTLDAPRAGEGAFSDPVSRSPAEKAAVAAAKPRPNESIPS